MTTKRTSPVISCLPASIGDEALQQNAILIGLDAPQIQIVTANGTLVHLKVREQIYQPDERISHVFFPIDSVLSVVTRMKDGHQIEIGTIGREGVSAIPLLLGAKSSLNESYCQVPASRSRERSLICRLCTISSPARRTSSGRVPRRA
jgi:hypothetical protein